MSYLKKLLISLPEKTKTKLEEYCFEKQKRMSHVIRDLVDREIELWEMKKQVSSKRVTWGNE